MAAPESAWADCPHQTAAMMGNVAFNSATRPALTRFHYLALTRGAAVGSHGTMRR
jgi:hypothetical protein